MSSISSLGLTKVADQAPATEAIEVSKGNTTWRSSMSLSQIREIGAAAQLAACPAETLSALKDLQAKEVESLESQLGVDLDPLRKSVELLAKDVAELGGKLTASRGGELAIQTELLQLRCDEAAARSAILGVVLRVRAHLKEYRYQQAERERQALRTQAEADFDQWLEEWRADAAVWKKQSVGLTYEADLLTDRIARLSSQLAEWEGIGFSLRVQQFLLAAGYAVMPALAIVFASLLHRLKSGSDQLLKSADPVGALAAVVATAAKDPAIWLAGAANYAGVVLAFGVFSLLLILGFDALLKRLDRRWKRVRSKGDPAGSAHEFVVRLHSFVLPGAESTTSSEPLNRVTYLSFLRRLPLLLLGALVFYVALQLSAVANNALPAPYVLVGFALPLLAAGSGISLGLLFANRPHRLVFVPWALLAATLTAPFVTLLPEPIAWPLVAGYLSLAMVAVGLAIVHRGTMLSNDRALRERREIQQILANMEATPSKTTFVLKTLGASQTNVAVSSASRRSRVIRTVERSFPGWVVRPLIKLLGKKHEEPAAETEPAAAKSESTEVPPTDSLNDPLMSRAGVPEELRQLWQRHRAELDVVVQKINAAIDRLRHIEDIAKMRETALAVWKKEQEEVAKRHASWLTSLGQLKIEHSQQLLAFELATKLAGRAAQLSKGELEQPQFKIHGAGK